MQAGLFGAVPAQMARFRALVGVRFSSGLASTEGSGTSLLGVGGRTNDCGHDGYKHDIRVVYTT